MNAVLELSPRLSLLPVVHGSADFALQVCRRLRREPCDCVALPLPPSFAAAVERGVEMLPRISVVVQREQALHSACTMVPIDPCQSVIAAIRQALEDGVQRAYVDLEVAEYEPYGMALPDPYALHSVRLERFDAALLPFMPPAEKDSQRLQRLQRMAYELHRLELEHEHVVCLCSVLDWAWLREAYQRRSSYAEHERLTDLPRLHDVAEGNLFFVLGELPFITHLYEHRRAELLNDGSLAIDGITALLLETRDRWRRDAESSDRRVTPKLLSTLLTYVRNLALMDRRLTPDLYNLALGAQQVVGDDFALELVEAARTYRPQRLPSRLDLLRVGVDAVLEAGGQARPCKNRLEGTPRRWRRLRLRPRPRVQSIQEWRLQWNPFGQCSYPPEDARIESFQRHVREQARILMGENEARTERFSTSLKDGLDLRETLRNWHTGDLYVRELPQDRGNIEVVVFLFETELDARKYPWQGTWHAEHAEESTLCFCATSFLANMVGPGIGQAQYGGCFFLFPPRPIADIWQDERLDFVHGMSERLIAGALLHSRERRVVLVAPCPPPPAWRRLARHLRKQLVHIPLQRFSASTVSRLRRFHVLNGTQVRSYAARFIRDLR